METHSLRPPEPDLKQCRAEKWLPQCARCLTLNRAGCPHVMHFGAAFMCCHPARDAIVADSLNQASRKASAEAKSDISA